MKMRFVLALILVCSSQWLAAADQPKPGNTKSGADVAEPAKAAELTSDQKVQLQALLLYQAKLQISIMDLQMQMARASAAWQTAKTEAMKVAKIDPTTHDVQLGQNGNLEVVSTTPVQPPTPRPPTPAK